MIIFGTGSTRPSDMYLLEGQMCNHCQNSDTVYAFSTTRYFDLFWIPTFPIGTKIYSTCTHCKNTLEKSEMPSTYMERANALGFKTPWWTFIGLILIGVGLLISLLT